VRWGRFIFTGAAVLLGAAFWGEAVLDKESAPVSSSTPEAGAVLTAPAWPAADAGKDHVHLRWRSVPGALAYSIWRSEGRGGEFEFLRVGRDTTYCDRDGLVSGKRYCYMLTATDPEFAESGFSRERCVEFQGTAPGMDSLAE